MADGHDPPELGLESILSHAMAKSNQQIAEVFQQMAAVLEILGGDHFRINAFLKAARVVNGLVQDLAIIGPDPVRLAALDGIGKGTAQRIAEFLKTGKVNEHQQLLAKIPPGLLDLLDISGLGAKTIGLLWNQAGVAGINDLKKKLIGNELAKLPGLGEKKLENLRKSIAFAQASGQRVRIGQALPLANWFVSQLRQIKGVKQAAYAGSLRRGKETVGDIDLVVAVDGARGDDQEATDDQAARAVGDVFVKLEPVGEVLVKGATKTSVRVVDPDGKESGGIQVDLRVVGPESFGAALLYFTGSKEHNVALRQRAIERATRLNEYGLYRGHQRLAGSTEDEVYRSLGLAWIPPELREDRGELVSAQHDKLPSLIELTDIKAELHAHTHASDGRWSIHQLVQAAIDRGFHTVAVTDHSSAQKIANGLSVKRLEGHIQDVRAVAQTVKNTIKVLAGSEVDILADGALDYPDTVLAQLDLVVASPHIALGQDSAKATKRLLKAIDNPYVTLIGHPTGRIIGRRAGISPDMKQVITAAARRGIALEINANSWRLDLNDINARWAIEAGVKLAINTDAHGPQDMEQLIYGVLTARRAGAQSNDVVNAMTQVAFEKWLKASRG